MYSVKENNIKKLIIVTQIAELNGVDHLNILGCVDPINGSSRGVV